jgi:hypothetical protein
VDGVANSKPVALGASFAGRNGAMILRSANEKLMILGVVAMAWR